MTERPNIVLIMTDQQRGDCLGVAGNPVLKTPNLDRLASEGVYFAETYSPMPVCVPSRYSIMTGHVPIAWGIRHNGGVIPGDVPTLPTILKQHGYRTYAVGKMHFTGPEEECKKLGIPRFRYHYGFDDILFSEEGRQWMHGDDYEAYLKRVGWYGWQRAHGIGNNDVRTAPSPLPKEHYQTVWATDESIKWLRENAGKGPFFLFCSYIKPHSPYDPPEPYHKLYDPRQVPPPFGGPEDLERLAPYYGWMRKAYGWHLLPDEAHLRARAYYYANITLIDEQVGRLLQTLDELGIADNTIVAFVSDHGDLMGDHGLYFKAVFFRESWHIPLIIRAPGRLPAKGRMERLASLQDLMPTLLSLAGIPLPKPVHGQDLTRSLDAGPEAVFGSYRSAPNRIHAVRTAQFQYVFHEAGGFEELYDVKADPQETQNLAGRSEYREVCRELHSRIARWLAELGDEDALAGPDRLKSGPAEELPEPAPGSANLGLRPY